MKYKEKLQNVMDNITAVEVGAMLMSAIAACDDLIYLIPFGVSIVALLYTRLWMRRWELE